MHGLWYISDCLLWQLWLYYMNMELSGLWVAIPGTLCLPSLLPGPLMEDYKYDRQSSVLILKI